MRKIYLALAFVLFGIGTALAQQGTSFRADSQINVKSVISVNNVTPVVIATAPATVYSIEAFNNAGTLAYVKLYNSSTAVCGSGTPQARYLIPFVATSAGGAISLPNINGDIYVNGITLCITTGIADNDTGAPAANAYIVNVHWKASL